MDDKNKNSDYSLDARGLFCPEPVMLLHKKIREIAVGETLSVVATDPSTTRDIPNFCHFLGHELLESSEGDNRKNENDKTSKEFFYLIRKAGSGQESEA